MTSSSVKGGDDGSRPNSFSTTTTWAELDTGRSSANPCTIARITTLNSDIHIHPKRLASTRRQAAGAAVNAVLRRHLNRLPLAAASMVHPPDAVTPSQQVTQVLQPETGERDVEFAGERHHLERFAHLLRHDQAPRLTRQARALEVADGLRHESLESQPDQE